MTDATVTAISTRHSWDKQPRLGEPNRHVYTCRRCGIKKRSEPDGRTYVEVWRAGDGSEGVGKVPPCPGSEPGAVAPPAVDPMPVSAQPATSPPCCRCAPPCGRPTRLYLAGFLCQPQADSAARARAGAA